MKIIKYAIVSLFSVLCSLFSQAVLYAEPLEYTAAEKLVLGEKLTYILRWGFFPVGYSSMHVESIEDYEGRPVYHIVVKAWSNTFLSTFYRVEDQYETYLDVKKMIPYQFIKKQREGKYRSDEVMIYDQEHHKAYYESLLNGNKKEMDIPDGVQDTLSAIYVFRTIALKVDENVVMNVNADEKNWVLKILVKDFIKKKEIKKMGVFDAFYVEPLAAFQGLTVRKGRIWVWISADRRRFPLLIKTKVPFGRVTAALIKAEIDLSKSEDRSQMSEDRK